MLSLLSVDLTSWMVPDTAQILSYRPAASSPLLRLAGNFVRFRKSLLITVFFLASWRYALSRLYGRLTFIPFLQCTSC